MRPDIDCYRANYDIMNWDDVRYANFPASLACSAIAALCDAYEEIEKQRDELVSICERVVNRGIGSSDVVAMKAAIASAKGSAS